MGLSYQEKYQVPFYESDINQNMKLSQLLSLVLQVSGKQSLSLGMSDEYVFQTYNLVWIITEYAIEIDRLPRYTENIVIETVPTAYNKLFCYRDFNVYGQDGEKILTIHSTFVLMDYNTRKFKKTYWLKIPTSSIRTITLTFTNQTYAKVGDITLGRGKILGATLDSVN